MIENYVFTKVPTIESKTIECDPVSFAFWLNDLAQRVNNYELISLELYKETKKLREEVACLDKEVKKLSAHMTTAESNLVNHEERLNFVEQQLSASDGIIGALNEKLEWFYRHLPSGIGNIPDSWKFGMGEHHNIDATHNNVQWIYGKLPYTKSDWPSTFLLAAGNINVMSGNNNTPSLNIGIFTKNAIEDNDIYFN